MRKDTKIVFSIVGLVLVVLAIVVIMLVRINHKPATATLESIPTQQIVATTPQVAVSNEGIKMNIVDVPINTIADADVVGYVFVENNTGVITTEGPIYEPGFSGEKDETLTATGEGKVSLYCEFDPTFTSPGMTTYRCGVAK